MNADEQTDSAGEEDSHDRWPIGFMLLVGAVALYLGWRLVQGIGWAVDWLAG